eukprot:306939-Chlamydomonas_euryale.AAC.1
MTKLLRGSLQLHLPVARHRGQSQSQSYRERTHEGYARVERGKAEGIEQRSGRCHKGHDTAHDPRPPVPIHTRHAIVGHIRPPKTKLLRERSSLHNAPDSL